MGNRFGRHSYNYRLITDEKKPIQTYKIYYISGGQKTPIPEHLRKFVRGGKVNKDGFVDKYINKYVVCENYNILHTKFISKIKPILYNIYELDNECWIGKTNREMLVRAKVLTPINTYLITNFYSNILVEDMGFIDDLDSLKDRPNVKIKL